jgi:hypothetical protein
MKGLRATFTLMPRPADLRPLAERYTAASKDVEREHERRITDQIAPTAVARGYFTGPEFVEVCLWKSRRPRRRYEAIPPDRVEETTSLALAARDEFLRIGILLTLDGVSWPTASVLLHFGHREPYPIVDVRALEALGVKLPQQYTFGFWWAYVQECRGLASRHGLDMRTLDRALWQWSKERPRR